MTVISIGEGSILECPDNDEQIRAEYADLIKAANILPEGRPPFTSSELPNAATSTDTTTSGILANEEQQRRVSACFDTVELPLDAIRRELGKADPILFSEIELWRDKLGNFAKAPEEVVGGSTFAAEIRHFHAERRNGQALAVGIDVFPEAMRKLQGFPEEQASLFKRNFVQTDTEGWRPIKPEEREQLTLWLEAMNNRRAARQVMRAQEAEGTEYTDYKYESNLRRLTGFAGHLVAMAATRNRRTTPESQAALAQS